MTAKAHIKNLSLVELGDLLEDMKQKRFRAKQVFEWLYKKHASSFEEMTNLSKDLRQALAERCDIALFKSANTMVSETDGTTKYLLELMDGLKIETVWIPAPGRGTVCVSTQAGCKGGCAFCASGAQGWDRNLTPAEITGQVSAVLAEGKTVTNIVLMGIGEPFDNFDSTRKALEIINAPEGMNIGARRITVSTAGIPDKILAFARLDGQMELAVSLHAPNNRLRDELVPLNRRYPIEQIMKSVREYIRLTNRQVTFEYVMLDGVNDSDMQAKALAHILKGLLCKVNLIPYNAHKDSRLKGSPRERVHSFREILENNRLVVTVRRSKGRDILAACGQLRNSAGKKKPRHQSRG